MQKILGLEFYLLEYFEYVYLSLFVLQKSFSLIWQNLYNKYIWNMFQPLHISLSFWWISLKQSKD